MVMAIVSNADALKAQFTDPVWLVERLGIRDFRREGGGVKILCPWHTESHPDCSVTLGSSGTIRVHCFGCPGGGSALDLIAAVRGIAMTPDDVKQRFAAVAEAARDLLGQAAAPQRAPVPPGARKGPPLAEVKELWGICRSVTAAADEIAARGLDAAEIDELGLGRLLPEVAALPSWARFQKKSWAERGNRFLIPFYGPDGMLATLHARRLSGSDTKQNPKGLSAAGAKLPGFVMADRSAQELLRTGQASRAGVIIAEGVPDFWTLATHFSDADAERPAVLGILSGSWTEEIAARIPDGTRVTVWTHSDRPKAIPGRAGTTPGAGSVYAARIRKTLEPRCTVRCIVQPIPDGAKKAPDANDLLQQGGRAAVQAVLAAPAPPPPAEDEPVSFLVGSESELATALLRALRCDRRAVYDLGSFYAWSEAEPANWQEVPQEELLRHLRRFDGAPVLTGRDRRVSISATRAKGAIGFAAAELRLEHPSFFEAAPPGVAFTNGFVRLRPAGGTELVPHSHEQRQLHVLPVAYQAAAPAPRFSRFLDEVLHEEDPAETRAKHLVLQEFVGACLFGLATRFERCVFLTGVGTKDGGNGKSQFLHIVCSLFPPEAVVTVEPGLFGDLRHRARFARARLNAVFEIEENELLDSGGLKALVSGDRITAEPKFKDPFDFTPRCGHIFNANTLPSVRDTTRGFWRRPLVVPFTRVFDTSSERVVDLHKVIIQAELAGIAAWAVAGAERLVRQNGYSEAASAEAAKAKWQTEANNVALYASQQLDRTVFAEHRLASSILYNDYKKWTSDGGYQPKSHIKFSQALQQAGFERHELKAGTFFGAAFRSAQNWNDQ